MGVPNCLQNWESVESHGEGDIDIDPAKQNYYTVHLSPINRCGFTSTEDIELAIITSF